MKQTSHILEICFAIICFIMLIDLYELNKKCCLIKLDLVKNSSIVYWILSMFDAMIETIRRKDIFMKNVIFTHCPLFPYS